MPLNIKNPEVERLIREISRLTGESKTETVRKALEERRVKLSFRLAEGDKRGRLKRFLENEVWPAVPKAELGRRLTRAEEDKILGYGKHGI